MPLETPVAPPRPRRPLRTPAEPNGRRTLPPATERGLAHRAASPLGTHVRARTVVQSTPPYATLCWVLVAVGAVLRLAQYAFNRSLWSDEASLALAVIGLSGNELLQPLPQSQLAPVGFLLLENLAVSAFGTGELALRLVPLTAGLVSLPLFLAVARRCLVLPAVPVAMALFALADPLVYYASEAKPYAVEVAFGLLLIWAALQVDPRRLAFGQIAGLGLIGAVAVWFAHPTVFVMAGVAVALVGANLAGNGRSASTRRLLAALLPWGLSFALCYTLLLERSVSNGELVTFWEARSAFPVFPPQSLAELAWFPGSILHLMKEALGADAVRISAILAGLGAVSLFARSRTALALLAGPLLATLIAACFQLYPFRGRPILFLAPVLALLVAEGVGFLWLRRPRPLKALAVAVLLLLLLPAAGRAVYHLTEPRVHEELRPTLDYVERHRREGDLLYVYYGADEAFVYYADRFGYERRDYVTGVNSRDRWQGYVSDLSQLRGRDRVWLVFSHGYTSGTLSEEEFFVRHLDGLGSRRHAFRAPNAAAYLYDLSAPPVAGLPAGRLAIGAHPPHVE